jgi:hypothetical protein
LYGVLYCLYSIGFRWSTVRNTYGRFDLYFWASYIITSFMLLGLFIDVIVFGDPSGE